MVKTTKDTNSRWFLFVVAGKGFITMSKTKILNIVLHVPNLLYNPISISKLWWPLFFGLIEKTKYFGFFYSAKSTVLITKLNLLIITSP